MARDEKRYPRSPKNPTRVSQEALVGANATAFKSRRMSQWLRRKGKKSRRRRQSRRKG